LKKQKTLPVNASARNTKGVDVMRRTLTAFVLGGALLFGSAGASWSGDFEKGLNAYEKEDYSTALQEWVPLAQQGNANAQYRLALMYEIGDGVDQNYKTAVKWHKLAAEQGHVFAQSKLGFIFSGGGSGEYFEGVPLNYETAVKWYELAAKQGDLYAQVSLGEMYERGQGVTQNFETARKLYKLAAEKGDDGARAALSELDRLLVAAEQGDAPAQLNLGWMYFEGKGVPQDYKTAVKWFRLAAEQGDAGAQYNLGLMYAKGQGIPQDDKTAVKWFRLAAEQGYADAQHNLGVMYNQGQGVPQDYKTAAKWYRLAAEQGIAHAQFNLGVMYANGRGVPQDNVYAHMWWDIAASSGIKDAVKNRDIVAKRMTEAEISIANELARHCIENRYKNCEQSGFQKGLTAYRSGDYATALREWTPLAEQGLDRAQYNLGVMYANGRGVPQDDKTAVKWYRLAAEQGYAAAQYKLGFMYANGRGVSQDYKTAAKWYTLAAEQGDAYAQFNLGVMYANGRGVPKDDKTAVKWYRLAAEQGNVRAQSNLGLMYFEGKGVPKDNVYAHMWYDVAASSGDKNVTELAVKNRDDAAKRMTEAEISTANELARRCIENRYKNCEQSDFQKGLTAYRSGDYATALREWTPLAEQGYTFAQYNLGVMYSEGQGVRKDDNIATKWHKLAAAQEFGPSQNYLMKSKLFSSEDLVNWCWNISSFDNARGYVPLQMEDSRNTIQCLEEAIVENILLLIGSERRREIQEKVKNFSRAVDNLNYPINNEVKYCTPFCGTMYDVTDAGVIAEFLGEMLKNVIHAIIEHTHNFKGPLQVGAKIKIFQFDNYKFRISNNVPEGADYTKWAPYNGTQKPK
jgi:TPR repeat protein